MRPTCWTGSTIRTPAAERRAGRGEPGINVVGRPLMNHLRRRIRDLRREADQFERLGMPFLAEINRREAEALDQSAEDDGDQGLSRDDPNP